MWEKRKGSRKAAGFARADRVDNGRNDGVYRSESTGE